MVKSSAYTPLDALVDLACRDGVDIRPTLLRVLTDLYVQKPAHSADEEIQYVELALGLINAVDAPTRAAVAARLSAYPAAPAAIRAKLAGLAPHAGSAQAAETETKPIPRNDLVELFFAASAEERRLILANLDVVAETTPHHPTTASADVIHRLETAALQRDHGEFCRTLERALGVNRQLAERITRDPSGEPIVVAAKALGMTAAVLQRVVLFLDPAIGQSVARVYALARLFDELTAAAAAYMLSIWQQSNARSPAVHAPQHWDDGRRDARSLSTPARYRSDRGRVELPSRGKISNK